MHRQHFTIVELQQGTPQWMAWRHGGIGASDAPCIMGENPWKSPSDLLREKRGPVPDMLLNDALIRGTRLEHQARESYVSRTGKDVSPACLQSNRYPWMRASVDGISSSGNTVVEIKCGKSAYTCTAQYGSIPPHHYGQLQHTLAVSGLTVMDYWCFLPGRPPILTPVPRDDPYIERLLKAEQNFWDLVQKAA